MWPLNSSTVAGQPSKASISVEHSSCWRSESSPLLPSSSHDIQYVPLLMSHSNHTQSLTTSATVTTASTATSTTMRPTMTSSHNSSASSVDTDSPSPSHSSSHTKDHSSLIQIELPESFCRRGDKLPLKETSTWFRLALALLFVFISMVINLTVLAIIHERVPRTQPTLPDIAFDVLPVADWALSLAEYLIVAQVSGVVLLLFLHRYRGVLFRRLCLIMGILYLFRAICMASTQLPIANKNYYCSPQLRNASQPSDNIIITTSQYIAIIASRVFYMSLGMGLSINGRHSYCGDYIYSGHTVILTLAYLMFREYLIPSRCRTLIWKCVNLLLWLCSFSGVFCILVARGHYFIDIVIAYYVTTRTFWIYHTLCYNNALRFESSTNYLYRVWWWRLFKFFESAHVVNCPAGVKSDGRLCNCCDGTFQQIPRSFEWPLPWPRLLRRKRRIATQRLLQAQQP